MCIKCSFCNGTLSECKDIVQSDNGVNICADCVRLAYKKLQKQQDEVNFEKFAGNKPVEFEDIDADPVSFWCWKAWQKALEIERNK